MSAFNDVDPIVLVFIPRDLGLPEILCRFIYNLASQREIFFNINGDILGPYIALKGVPQGCVLSPLFYNIITIVIDRCLSGCGCLEFAGDTVLYVTSWDLDYCISTLQSNLKNLKSHLGKLGLKISEEKKTLVIHSRTHIDTSEYRIVSDNEIITPSPSAVLLGVTMDSTLTWEKHITSLINKCHQSINIIKSLRTTWWGAHQKSLLLIYKALVVGAINYSLHFIAPRNQKRLQKLAIA